MVKKMFTLLGTILLLSCVGCANTQKADYPLCNATSKYKMIETEDG